MPRARMLHNLQQGWYPQDRLDRSDVPRGALECHMRRGCPPVRRRCVSGFGLRVCGVESCVQPRCLALLSFDRIPPQNKTHAPKSESRYSGKRLLPPSAGGITGITSTIGVSVPTLSDSPSEEDLARAEASPRTHTLIIAAFSSRPTLRGEPESIMP